MIASCWYSEQVTKLLILLQKKWLWVESYKVSQVLVTDVRADFTMPYIPYGKMSRLTDKITICEIWNQQYKYHSFPSGPSGREILLWHVYILVTLVWCMLCDEQYYSCAQCSTLLTVLYILVGHFSYDYCHHNVQLQDSVQNIFQHECM
jgi:hypothetical protein